MSVGGLPTVIHFRKVPLDRDVSAMQLREGPLDDFLRPYINIHCGSDDGVLSQLTGTWARNHTPAMEA